MAGIEHTEGSGPSPMDEREHEMWFDLNEPHSSVPGSLRPPFTSGNSLGEGDYPRTRSNSHNGLSSFDQGQEANAGSMQQVPGGEEEQAKNLDTLLGMGFTLAAANTILGLQETWNERIDFSPSSPNLERGSEEGFREWQRRNGFSD